MDEIRSAGKLLRIFVDEADRFGGKPLYVAIVERMLEAGFAGASVLKGIEGFGTHREVHAARVFDLSTNLPVLIEVMETEERITAFLPVLRDMVAEGLITLETVQLIRFSETTP